MNQKPITIDGTFKSYDDKTIYWKKYQPICEERASLVFIHGVLDHSGIYDYLGDDLTSQGFTLYSFDIRGFGRSGGKRGHVDSHWNWVNDLSVFHNEVVKPQLESPLFLLSVSMGSIIAINHLRDKPEGIRGVVLSEMGMEFSPIVKASSGFARFVSSFLPGFRIKAFMIPPLLTPSEEPKSKSYFDPYMDNTMTAKLGWEMDKAFKESLNRVKELRLPVLYQYGSKDRVFSKHKDFFSLIGSTDKTIIAYKGYHHDIYKESKSKREIVVKDLTGWIDKHI